jgi:hypothetical protein
VSWKLTTPSDEQVKVACERCANTTKHDIVASYELSDSTEDVIFGDTYQIIRCRGCESVSFRNASWNSEDLQWDYEAQQEVARESEELYPRRSRRTKSVAREHLPTRVAAVYIETIQAANNDHRILAGIGVRALVEAVCAEKQASGKDLEKKIDDLVTKGVLGAEGAAILHGTRLLGNIAAHQATPPTAETLAAALDVAEHLLSTVYVIPSIASHLPKPKPKAAASAPKPTPTPKVKASSGGST